MTTTIPGRKLVDVWTDLGQKSGDDIASMFHRLRDAGATPDELSRALSMRITAQNMHAGALGEGMARSQLTTWGIPGEIARVPMTAVAHELDRDRLAQAVLTILSRAEPADVVAGAVITARAVHRLARSEAVQAGQRTFHRTMSRARSVKGWTRVPEPDACELCEWWARDGRVWPRDHAMPTHKGCTCAQQFVLVERAERPSVSQSARDASKLRHEAGTLDQRRQMTEGQYSERSERGTNRTPGTP